MARAAATEAALARLDGLADRAAGPHARSSTSSGIGITTAASTRRAGSDEADRELLEHQQIRQAVLEAERGTLVALRDRRRDRG